MTPGNHSPDPTQSGLDILSGRYTVDEVEQSLALLHPQRQTHQRTTDLWLEAAILTIPAEEQYKECSPEMSTNKKRIYLR
jgi:hypothetical protein